MKAGEVGKGVERRTGNKHRWETGEWEEELSSPVFLGRWQTHRVRRGVMRNSFPKAHVFKVW